MTETVQLYMTGTLMATLLFLCISRLADFSFKTIISLSALWGAIGAITLLAMSDIGDLQHLRLLNQELMFVVIFIECATLIFCSVNASRQKGVITSLICRYTGVTVIFPIAYGASILLMTTAGLPFTLMGASYGVAIALILLSGTACLRWVIQDATYRQALTYYCSLFVVILCVIICGLQSLLNQ